MHPTHRISPGRKRRRRSHHALERKQVDVCPNCGEVKLPHCACSNCGYVKPGLQLREEKEEE
ncbi:MAG: 50S ribosomal protein L32 [Planctomycetota bacterium]